MPANWRPMKRAVPLPSDADRKKVNSQRRSSAYLGTFAAHCTVVRDWRERARKAHYSEAELARLCNVSPRTLQRYFHGKLHTRLRVWLTRMRIKDSKAKLLQFDTQIKEVAYAAGYTAATNFCRQFKQTCGLTPREWVATQRIVH